MAYYYLKLYHEILDDPKMGRLPDRLYRRVIEIFLIASASNDRDGFLPPVNDMAWKLRLSPDDLSRDLTDIEVDTGIVKLVDGRWHVTNFVKRQSAVTVNERVKRYREREHSGNDNETSRYTELRVKNLDIDKDIDKDKNKVVIVVPKVNEDAKNAYRLYEQEIGLITPYIADAIGGELDNNIPFDWIKRAIEIAVTNNARSWAYIAAVLKNWKENGFEDKRKKSNNGKQSPPKIDWLSCPTCGRQLPDGSECPVCTAEETEQDD